MRALAAVSLGLFLAIATVDQLARASGRGVPVSFECRVAGDGGHSLTCDTTGLSEAQAPPEWYVAEPGGKLVDRARGWNAVDLWPTAGEAAEIIMQARPPGRAVQLRCAASAGQGCGATER